MREKQKAEKKDVPADVDLVLQRWEQAADFRQLRLEFVQRL